MMGIAREFWTIPNTLLLYSKKFQNTGLLRKRKRYWTTYWQLTDWGEKATGNIRRS